MARKRKLRIEPRPHFGFRVTNENGEAELGTWHIADFAWEEDAKLFVDAYNRRQARTCSEEQLSCPVHGRQNMAKITRTKLLAVLEEAIACSLGSGSTHIVAEAALDAFLAELPVIKSKHVNCDAYLLYCQLCAAMNQKQEF